MREGTRGGVSCPWEGISICVTGLVRRRRGRNVPRSGGCVVLAPGGLEGGNFVGSRLEGKACLIIGAGSIGPGWGNGKATAARFADEGGKVICVDLNAEAAEETAEVVRDRGGEAISLQADASSEADIERIVAQSLEAFGSIDVLNNNVGIAPMGGVCDLSTEDWDRAFDINLKSCFLGMKHVIPQMVEQGGGSIINTSSIASIRYTGVNYATYYASKAAMNHLSATTASEFASRKVRVNTVLPGLLKTPMMVAMAEKATAAYGSADLEEMWRKRDAQVPMGHMGDAWDVANAVLFLASDEARYITGIDLVVDGGITLKFA